MTTALATLTTNFAARFGLGDNQQELIDTLKATAFKGGNVTDAQMTALMLVAQQYNLNPWLKEIYAFPDKGGIVPIVGVDGWARIMNDHPQFDGMEFEQNDEQCTCVIFRKDRSHAIKATEYMSECKRGTGPWQSHPRRMLRHKAMIQCARLAFGFGGIYDQDEAERIIESETIEAVAKEIKKIELPECTAEKFDQMCVDVVDADGVITRMGWKSLVSSGTKEAAHLLAMLQTKYTFSDEQLETVKSWEPANENA